MMAAYDWSGFYVGANGGYGSSSNCWNLDNIGGVPLFPEALSPRVAVAPLAGWPWPAVSLVTVGRPAPWWPAWKRRVTGPICAAPI